MLALNYAILKHFTKVKEACAEDVIEILKGEYGGFKALKLPAIVEALLTAEANGLIEETRYELDGTGALKIYYHCTEEQAANINNYIKGK